MLVLGHVARGEQTSDPTTPAAKSAIQKYEKAAAQAKADFDKAMKEAQTKASAELDRTLKDVMKKGDLDEANRIRGAVTRIASDEAGEGVGVADLKSVVNRKIVFFRIEPGIATMTLAADGSIGGYSNKNESAWRMRDGALQFIASDGSVSSEYRMAFHANGLTCLIGRAYVVADKPLVGLFTLPAKEEK
jgi:hypothetical protein